MASVTLRGLAKTYDSGGTQAVADLSLDVRDGEFFVLLGPSACGKTTVLRCIAGLEEPTAGEILIGDQDVTHLSPGARDVAMVFQSHALYPHLSVRGNIAFGLEVRGVPAAEITRRVEQAAGRLGLTAALERRPGALSGGERQRVALARAIVREPRVFLYDEPLANLDPTLRGELRAEHVRLSAPDQGMATAEVRVVEPLGADTLIHLDAGGHRVVARVGGFSDFRPGDRVGVTLDRRHLHLFDAAGARLA